MYTNDRELWKDFVEGNEDAFKEVFRRLNKPLLYFAHKMKIGWEACEDVVADSFAKLNTRKATMESWDHIKRWMYVITRNAAVDCLRHNKQERLIRNECGTFTTEDEEMDLEEETDLEMLKSSLLGSLQEALQRLPRQRKAVIEKYFFENKTTSQIAEEMGLDPQTVLNHKSRGIRALSREIPIDLIINEVVFS